MNTAVVKTILQDRKITYVVTDRHLRIVELSDAVGVFQENGYQSLVGNSLLELVPELVGNEVALGDILAGNLPRFELPWVNFELIEGQTQYLNMVDLPHRDSMGQIVGIIHLVQDVTDMGEIHQQLAQHRNELSLLQQKLARQNRDLATINAELQRLSDAKSMFVSVAAHELNSPLASILGYLELLLDTDIYDPLTANQREVLDILYHSAKRLTNIVKNLLDVTRIETERIELALKPVNLVEMVESLLAEFKPQLQTKGQTLSLHIQPDLPYALCDENRTAQIISNLISNAIKYTLEQGKIKVKINLIDSEEFLQIAIADNGVGISIEDQAQMFRRFFRAKSAGLAGATGSGLGLYITQSLVELQGGQIWFESELNKGSTFFITLPVAGRLIDA